MIPGNMLSLTTEMIDPNISGWTAKSNCTISLGSGGRSGDGILKVVAAGAGEMQVRTYSSYPVTPGVTYWTFADASASTQAERIGIRWLSAAGAELSVTWGLTTASASLTWHRVSVAGIAPVGAARAQVLLSATAQAAAATQYWENVYFGLPIRMPGNLLSFNAESGGELDLSAWAAGINSTISRTAVVAPFGATTYTGGGEQVALIVTAAGDADAVCVERPAVTPGVEYVGLAYLNPPTSTAQTWVELRWYDASGALLQAARSVLAASGTGWYRQITSGIAPATAVTAGLAVGITAGTAGQIVRTDGAYLGTLTAAMAGTQRTGNIMPLADWDFEQGVGSWTVVSGAAAIARSTPWGSAALYDSYSLTVTSATATTSVLRSGRYSIGATAGTNWRSQINALLGAGGWSFGLAVRWYDASGTDLGTTAADSGTIQTPGWWTYSDDQTAPAGATQAALEYTLTATATSSRLQIDRPALYQTLPQVQVDVDTDGAGARLILREITPGILLTLWRVGPDGSRSFVRGPDGLYDGTVEVDTDSLQVQDYEAPLGVPLYYLASLDYQDGGAPETRTSDTFTIPAGDPNYVELSDPGRPGLGVRVMVETAPEWQQDIPQTVHQIRGRSAPVILSDVRSSRTGSLVCWTQTDEEREALRYLLSSGDPLLWRSAPGMGEPDVYVSVGQTAAPRVSAYAPEPWREWTLPLTEVDMPTGGTAGSADWTVADVAVTFASVADVTATYASVFDLATDQRGT